MVAAAAGLGRRVTFDLLAAVTGVPEDDLIVSLRAAVDSGLLVETGPDVFSFHHDLAREAVESGLLGRQRRRLHEAALGALRHSDTTEHVALPHHPQGASSEERCVGKEWVSKGRSRCSPYHQKHKNNKKNTPKY